MGAAEAGSGPPLYDGWELEQQLRHIERVLKTGSFGSGRSQAAEQQGVARLDPPRAGPPAWHLPPAGKPARTPKSKAAYPHATLAVLTWGALALGTATFVCGGILLGWSTFTGQGELWTVGMPLVLGGQIALLVGLILLLDQLWHDSRHAAAKLDQFDEQLHKLKTATATPGTGNHSLGSAFYSHLAHGASPQLLLSDLKSQLDLLVLKLEEER